FMQTVRSLWSAGVMLCVLIFVFGVNLKASEPPLSSYIRPFVGTQGEGNTYPGPSAPFGMIQLSPDTDRDLWDTASGYEYSDTSIMGFSLTHLTGTGIPDLGDFLFIPQIGEPKLVAGSKEQPDLGYRARYSHQQEAASAAYYRVKLQNNNVTVELTAGERAGMLRFTFPESDQASIMTDLQHFLSGNRFRLIWSHVRVEDQSTVTGFHLVNGWAKERYLYFAARYSRPFDRYRIMSNGSEVKYDSRSYRFRSRNEAAGTNLLFLAEYKTRPGEQILVKVAVSAISAANALQNLDSEVPRGEFNFEKMRQQTCAGWDRELSRIRIEGSRKEKETFYTAMYHAFLAPNLYEDSTGEYRGLDSNPHHAKNFKNYAVFSTWDTFRATHPLFALIQAQRDSDMINSLLAHYDQSVDHLLPIWSLQGNETWCMIGYHSVPIIADGYLKGVRGFAPERAYEAMKATAMNRDYDSVARYAQLGWVPFDQENESVSKTLEYAFDDYCIAQMARALGHKGDEHYFRKRADSYRNVFDPSTLQVRGKNSKGQWRTPFDPHAYGEGAQADFTEGTATQYTFYDPQDVPGMIALFGGKEKFIAQLDALFEYQEPLKNQAAEDIQGRIGEYWHGNEPSHHIIYLYTFAGQPWKTAQRLHEVMRTQYGNQPNSLSGNDDCGQMSAWYIFTALGFYPVCPASDYYVIGSPSLPHAVMQLSNGRKFVVEARDLSERNIYVQSVKLNGKDWVSPLLPFRELKRGGRLEFTMGPEPSPSWGTEIKPAP
ncbi:MAG TPA: GH92 family glycosyl hydrolase, partial [Verrucomicrobiae bacterium]|nr:GH92 family glycosyl hydrolase [Verrucomicrobiae bacterium]